MNKKAILGMLVATTMSLGVMNGINGKQVEDSNLQHLSYACAQRAVNTEDKGTSLVYGACFAWGVETTGSLVVAGVANIYNPVGWGCLLFAAGYGL